MPLQGNSRGLHKMSCKVLGTILGTWYMLRKYIVFLFTSPLCFNSVIRISQSVFFSLALGLCDQYNLNFVLFSILVFYIRSCSHCLSE